MEMKDDNKTLFLSMEVEIMKMSILIDEVLLTRLDSAAITEQPTSSDTRVTAAAITETDSLGTVVAAITKSASSESAASAFTETTVPSHNGTSSSSSSETGSSDTEAAAAAAAAITEATVVSSSHCTTSTSSSSSVKEVEVEKFKRVLLQIKGLLDAETSVEKWVIDYLRLGQLKGFIFEDEQVPRVETSSVLTWWRQLRLVLDDVRDVFDEISIDVSTITGLRERLHDVINLKPQDPTRIDYGSNMDVSTNVVGRQEEVKRIIKLLVSDIGDSGIDKTPVGTLALGTLAFLQSSVDAQVIPIIGDSGIGKTAVTKLVYNDDKVNSHFDMKMWINLSNQSLSSLGFPVTEQGISDKHFTFSNIQNSLHGKKFLLVLDGVSNEILCDWAALQILLMDGANGSRIIITTRSFSSSTLVTIPPFRLQPLSYGECCELFLDRASRDNNAVIPHLRCYQNMLKWFQGFPSLVVALGDFSHSNPNEVEIQRVVDVINHSNALVHISCTMLEEYHGLPSMHIKQCLLYCALFPKGYQFKKRKLVYLWMAEGFIQPKRGLTIEQVGFQYFEELLFTSFLHLKYEFLDNSYSTYFMTDVVHNFVEYISGNEYFRIDNKETHFSGNARHLSVHWKEASGHGFKDLQTLLLIGELDWATRCNFIKLVEKLPQNLFDHLKGLHVLDLSCTGLVELPDSIHHLKHLRFLDLSVNPLKRLPEQMSMLRNLETLIITETNIEQFPRDMGSLIGLQHLILGRGHQSFVMPPGIGKLTKLQTLPAFIIGSKSDEVGRIEDLRELVHLRGSLLILGLNNVPPEKATQGGWLADKAYLQQLELFWNQWYDIPRDPETAENLLAGLQPHTNLIHLEIKYYGGLKFPFWLGDPSFSNLETIELRDCKSCVSLPPFGQLPFLKSLTIERMDALEYIDDGFLGKRAKAKRFPSLRTLIFEELSGLEKWSGLGKGDMYFLEQLEVHCCKMLTSLPTLQFLGSLKELSITNCPKVESLQEKKLPCSLESFVIMGCPLLEEKIEKLGEEWWKRKKIKLQIMKL